MELAVPGTYRAGMLTCTFSKTRFDNTIIAYTFHVYVLESPVVTIASFATQLVVITSKQRPRKLTIHGSDGEDYAFLLKGHEDLRQDERVMQVFCS